MTRGDSIDACSTSPLSIASLDSHNGVTRACEPWSGRFPVVGTGVGPVTSCFSGRIWANLATID